VAHLSHAELMLKFKIPAHKSFVPQPIKYTLCVPKKVVHETHGDNFISSKRIFKILSLLEIEVISNKSHIILPIVPSVGCRTTLQKLEVRILVNLEEKANKNITCIDF